MRWHRVIAVLGVVALVPATAGAQTSTRICIAGVQGDPEHAIVRGLASALCSEHDCVPKASVYRNGKPDFARVRAERVSGIVFGAVTSKAGRRTAWLALLTRSPQPARTWTIPLDRRGALSRSSLAEIADEVRAEIAPPPPVRPERRPAIAESKAAAPPPPPALPAARPPPPSAGPELAPAAIPDPVVRVRPVVLPPAPPRDAEPVLRRRAAVELGISAAQRNLSYSGASTSGAIPLRKLEGGAILTPRVRIELQPFALTESRSLDGLGIFADYGRSVGFTTAPAETPDQKHDVTYSRLSAGAAWRFQPLDSWALAVVPAVSYERRTFDVASLAGVAIAGLPNADLAGWKLGLSLELPLSRRIALLAGGGYVLWTTAKDLIDGYFPGGSASGVEAEAGVSIAVGERWSVRAIAEYGVTAYDLDPDPSGTYRASGATDRWLTGRAMVRFGF